MVFINIKLRHPSRSGNTEDDTETVVTIDPDRITTVGELRPLIFATNPDLIPRAEDYILEHDGCLLVHVDNTLPKPEDGSKELKMNMHWKFLYHGANIILDQKDFIDGVYDGPDDQNVYVHTSWTVSQLKLQILDKTKVTPNQQSLSTMGAPMENWLLVSDYIVDLDSQKVHLRRLPGNQLWISEDYDIPGIEDFGS